MATAFPRISKQEVHEKLALRGTGFWARTCSFFMDDPVGEETSNNPAQDRKRYAKAVQQVQKQAYIIAGLVLLNILLAPVLRPTFINVAVTPEKAKRPMIGLSEPNQTDQTILSWAATSITEIMTFGFGDLDQRILMQKGRFTDSGWDSFLEEIKREKIREGFKMRQLVLTTVPTDSPVIVSKGAAPDDENSGDGDYRWIVEMPVVMTYLTNNNVSTAKRGIVRLTIVRVPSKKSVTGIGIKAWQFM